MTKSEKLPFLAGRTWVGTAHVNTAFLLFFWSGWFLACGLTPLHRNEYGNMNGWCVMVSPYWSVHFFLPLCFHKTSISVSFFPRFMKMCAYSQGSEVINLGVSVVAVSVYNWTDHTRSRASLSSFSNSVSGTRHLVRLLYMMKHHAMNTQSWKLLASRWSSYYLR